MPFGVFVNQWVNVQRFIRTRRVEPVAKDRKQDKRYARREQHAQETVILLKK